MTDETPRKGEHRERQGLLGRARDRFERMEPNVSMLPPSGELRIDRTLLAMSSVEPVNPDGSEDGSVRDWFFVSLTPSVACWAD